MTISADKLAPRVIALAVVGYCVWPSIAQFVAQPDAKPPQKTSALAASLLRPAIPPPPTRDPFGLAGAAPRAAGREGPMPPVNSAGSGEAALRAGPAGAASQAAGLDTAAGQNVNPFAGLTLEATCIVGDHRLAMINGRLYAPRETLLVSAAPALGCKVLEVFPYKVVLDCQGKKVELSYSDVASARNSRGLTAPGKGPPSRSSGQKH